MTRKVVVFAALSFLVAAAGPPAESQNIFSRALGSAHLTGAEEVPPVDTLGQGQATLLYGATRDEIAFRVNVAGVRNITQSHIHCGLKGVNGPVVAFLFGLVGGGVNLNGVLATGTITGANIIPRPSSAACPGGVGDMDDLLMQIHNGNTYVNVHSIAWPGGEVRGQVQPLEVLDR